ncbi:MAG TPA: hypothetical protein VGH30_06320 [Jatrophihabitantaceae bacterium]|jgi:hypothetical protein
MRQRNATAATVLLVASDATALIALRPRATLFGDLTHLHRWLAAAGVDAASAQLAAALLWSVALWLGVALLACGCTTMPGTAGRAARWFARLVLPRAVYRIVAGALGMGIALAPITSAAASAGAAAVPARSGLPTAGAPRWPTGDSGAPHAPRWPTAAPRSASVTSAAPAPAHDIARHPNRAPATPAPEGSSQVVVHRGDSLWQIAAEHLSGRPNARRVAAAWPRWYAANRRGIGDDPNLIHPGAVLRPPTEGSH